MGRPELRRPGQRGPSNAALGPAGSIRHDDHLKLDPALHPSRQQCSTAQRRSETGLSCLHTCMLRQASQHVKCGYILTERCLPADSGNCFKHASDIINSKQHHAAATATCDAFDSSGLCTLTHVSNVTLQTDAALQSFQSPPLSTFPSRVAMMDAGLPCAEITQDALALALPQI